jgi:phosphoribosylformylglycinamidine cyclo-ligase
VSRVLPDNCKAVIRTKSWTVPPVFKYMQSLGVKRSEMFRVFNMGIGYVVIVRPAFASAVIGHFRRCRLDAVAIGEIRKGDKSVELT